MSNKINFSVQNNDYASIFIFNYIFFIIGVKSEFIEYSDTNYSDINIIYGRKKPNNFNGIFILEKETERFDINVIKKAATNFSKEINIDIIKLIDNFLCDTVNNNKSNNDFDSHDRLKFESSFQYINNLSKQPLVNIIIGLFEKIIEEFFKIDRLPLWPNQKKCVIILSHDVDAPIKYAHLFNYKLYPNISGSFIKHYYHFLKISKDYILDKNKCNYWLFDEIIKCEKSFGFKSTFFFSVINNKDKGANFVDVDYRVTKERFRNLFCKINKENFEIGLHASYNAYQQEENFIKEKSILENNCDSEVIGLRHHYWHLGKDYRRTLKYHNNAGFQYDSSIAFNDHLGFRNNIAFPYPIYYKEENIFLKLIEIPTFCMDGHIFYNNISKEKGFHEIISMIQSIKNNQGIGAFDWHVRTSYPGNKEYKDQGELYLEILKWLSNDNEIWVTNYLDVINWLKTRKERLQISNKFS